MGKQTLPGRCLQLVLPRSLSGKVPRSLALRAGPGRPRARRRGRSAGTFLAAPIYSPAEPAIGALASRAARGAAGPRGLCTHGLTPGPAGSHPFLLPNRLSSSA